MTTEQIKGLINAKIATYTRWKQQHRNSLQKIADGIKSAPASYQALQEAANAAKIEEIQIEVSTEVISALQWLLDDIEEAEEKENSNQ